MFNTGKLIVKPERAQLLHNKDLIGKMDPYCIMTIGNQKVKSSVCKRGGKTPKWDDALTLDVHHEQKMKIELYDRDRFRRDDYIGECYVPLGEIYEKVNLEGWYPVVNKGLPEGNIYLSFFFIPDVFQFNQGPVKNMARRIGSSMEDNLFEKDKATIYQNQPSSPCFLSKSTEFYEQNFDQITSKFAVDFIKPAFDRL